MLTENLANKEQLLRLAVQLNYQNQRHLSALNKFNEWRDLHLSENSIKKRQTHSLTNL